MANYDFRKSLFGGYGKARRTLKANSLHNPQIVNVKRIGRSTSKESTVALKLSRAKNMHALVCFKVRRN